MLKADNNEAKVIKHRKSLSDIEAISIPKLFKINIARLGFL
jgi:hypothetical protein